jgi:fructosamine-3-kinase
MTLLIGSLGQFNYERWRKRWAELFASHRLVHNIRNTRKIIVAKEVDGAFAVVDIDTWKNDRSHRIVGLFPDKALVFIK